MIIDYFTISNSEITATFSIESVQRSHGYASGYTQVETWILREGDRVIRTSYGRGIKKMEKDFQKAKDNALSKGYIVIEPDGTIKKEIKEEPKEAIDNSITETVKEPKEEPIDNTVVKAVKEVTLQDKIAKLQTKLTRLNAQFKITKGNRNKAKLVLKIESVIEQLERVNTFLVKKEPAIKVKDITVKLPVSVSTLKKHCGVPSAEMTDKEIINGWKYSLAAQSMQKDWRLTEQISWADRHLISNIVHWVDQYQQEMDKRGLTEKYCLWIEKKEEIQDEFCKKPDRKTIKLIESKFKDAQIEITETQVILKNETSELKLDCFVEIPYIDEYYNHRRKKLIKRLRDGQTSKAHSVCEYIGSILLTA